MKLESPNDFANGIIEIFKLHRVYELFIKDVSKKGEVKCELVIKIFILTIIEIFLFLLYKYRIKI
jgi:hypothetical protein